MSFFTCIWASRSRPLWLAKISFSAGDPSARKAVPLGSAVESGPLSRPNNLACEFKLPWCGCALPCEKLIGLLIDSPKPPGLQYSALIVGLSEIWTMPVTSIITSSRNDASIRSVPAAWLCVKGCRTDRFQRVETEKIFTTPETQSSQDRLAICAAEVASMGVGLATAG